MTLRRGVGPDGCAATAGSVFCVINRRLEKIGESLRHCISRCCKSITETTCSGASINRLSTARGTRALYWETYLYLGPMRDSCCGNCPGSRIDPKRRRGGPIPDGMMGPLPLRLMRFQSNASKYNQNRSYPVALRNGPVIQGFRPNQAEQGIAAGTSMAESISDIRTTSRLSDHRLVLPFPERLRLSISPYAACGLLSRSSRRMIRSKATLPLEIPLLHMFR